MSFSPTFSQASQTQEGVKFTLHRIGLGRRAAIDVETLSFRQRLRELEMEYPAQSPKEEELAEQLGIAQRKLAISGNEAERAVATADVKAIARDLTAAAPLEVRTKRSVLDEEYATVQGKIRLAWIRAGLVNIEGGEFAGVTADQLLEYGPVPLAQEIYEALTNEGRLAGPAAKNSSSPGTSGAPDSQAMTSTAVENAKSADGMPSAIASDILEQAYSPV